MVRVSISTLLARVVCCFTDWCNENTEVAVRSQNFITEPLSRLEMNDIVRQVDFINRYRNTTSANL